MGTLAFVCPATGKSVFTDLEIDQSIYSSILKNRLSHMHCSQCGERHELSEVVSWLAENSDTPPEAASSSSHWLLEEEAMPTIYISDRGDDKNDGLSLQTPVYSLKRAQKLQGGKNEHSWHFGPRAWERIKKELADKHEKK